MIYSGINNYYASSEMKKQMGTLGREDIDCSSKTTFTTEDLTKMLNLGNATVKENNYINGKLTSLKIVSNNYTYVLCSNGSTALESECDVDTPVEPSVSESVPFFEDSWETIANNIKNGNASVYNIGDTKEVTLTGEYAGTYTVRIANNSTSSECLTEGFSQTACGFVVEFVDIITNHVVNSFPTNSGGWPGSELYNFVNTAIYNSLPSDLQNVIIETFTVSGHGSENSSNFTSTDKLYLLSPEEVWGKEGTDYAIDYDSAEIETRQLDYYKKYKVTISSYPGVEKYYQGNAQIWWLRTANSVIDAYFYSVYIFGNSSNNNANDSYGVAPAFRIG